MSRNTIFASSTTAGLSVSDVASAASCMNFQVFGGTAGVKSGCWSRYTVTVDGVSRSAMALTPFQSETNTVVPTTGNYNFITTGSAYTVMTMLVTDPSYNRSIYNSFATWLKANYTSSSGNKTGWQGVIEDSGLAELNPNLDPATYEEEYVRLFGSLIASHLFTTMESFEGIGSIYLDDNGTTRGFDSAYIFTWFYHGNYEENNGQANNAALKPYNKYWYYFRNYDFNVAVEGACSAASCAVTTSRFAWLTKKDTKYVRFQKVDEYDDGVSGAGLTFENCVENVLPDLRDLSVSLQYPDWTIDFGIPSTKLTDADGYTTWYEMNSNDVTTASDPYYKDFYEIGDENICVRETTVPDGYRGIDGTIKINLSTLGVTFKGTNDSEYGQIEDGVVSLVTDGLLNGQILVKIVNKGPAKGKVTISIVDEETDSADARGEADVKNATFSIFDSEGNVVKSGVVPGSDGTVTIDLVPGDYTVKQTGNDDGYVGSTEEKGFTIVDESTEAEVKIKNRIKKGGVEILKTKEVYGEADAPFSGVEFIISDYLGAEVTRIETGANGKVSVASNVLIYGHYTISEVGGEKTEGYTIAASRTVFIDEDGVIKTVDENGNALTFRNELEDGGTLISKTDAASEDGAKKIPVGESVEIVDKVSYQSLKVGKRYKFSQTAYYEDDGVWYVLGSSEKTITTTNESGEVPLNFTVDTARLTGKRITILTKLYRVTEEGELLVFMHNGDKTNGDETVTVKSAEIKSTSAWNVALDKSKTLGVGVDVKVLDKVVIEGLVYNENYKLYSEVVDKDGEVIASETTTFLMTLPTGRDFGENVEINLGATKKYEGETLTVFEYLCEASMEDCNAETAIAKHASLNDADQQVEVQIVKIETMVSDTVVKLGKTSIKDMVEIENLNVGETYILEATVMTEKDGEILAAEAEGEKVTASKKFIVTSMDQMVEAELYFDLTKYAGKKMVVFETVKDESGKIVIGEHKNFDDMNQTFYVAELPVPEAVPQTGAEQKNPEFAKMDGVMLGAGFSGAGVLILYFFRKVWYNRNVR